MQRRRGVWGAKWYEGEESGEGVTGPFFLPWELGYT